MRQLYGTPQCSRLSDLLKIGIPEFVEHVEYFYFREIHPRSNRKNISKRRRNDGQKRVRPKRKEKRRGKTRAGERPLFARKLIYRDSPSFGAARRSFRSTGREGRQEGGHDSALTLPKPSETIAGVLTRPISTLPCPILQRSVT